MSPIPLLPPIHRPVLLILPPKYIANKSTSQSLHFHWCGLAQAANLTQEASNSCWGSNWAFVLRVIPHTGSPSVHLLQPHLPAFCFSNMPSSSPSQGLCTCSSLCLEVTFFWSSVPGFFIDVTSAERLQFKLLFLPLPSSKNKTIKGESRRQKCEHCGILTWP